MPHHIEVYVGPKATEQFLEKNNPPIPLLAKEGPTATNCWRLREHLGELFLHVGIIYILFAGHSVLTDQRRDGGLSGPTV